MIFQNIVKTQQVASYVLIIHWNLDCSIYSKEIQLANLATNKTNKHITDCILQK